MPRPPRSESKRPASTLHEPPHERRRAFGSAASLGHHLLRGLAGALAGGWIVMPHEPLRVQGMAGVGGQRNGATLIEQQRRVTAHPPMRAERDRYAEHRRLEHRVESRAMKAAADERGIAERVEIGENADA